MHSKSPGNRFGKPNRSPRSFVVVTGATVFTIVVIVYLVRDLLRQPLLITSLASSTFLLYYDPYHEFNRFRPLVFGQMIAGVIGFSASLLFSTPLLGTLISITATVSLMMLLRIANPPAVSTSLAFAYRPQTIAALVTFMLALLTVAVLAILYFLLWHVIRPSRFGQAFGLLDGLLPDKETDL